MSHTSADIAVIGAGVVGLCTALALADTGLDVILLSDARAGEASPAAGGILDTGHAFADPVPKHDVPGWLARADVCLLPYQDIPLFAGALPNKTFDYLGAGRPVIAAVPRGELSTLIEDAACGIAIAPEDPAAMADAVVALADAPERGRVLGRAGREYVVRHYDRAALADRFVAVIESLA